VLDDTTIREFLRDDYPPIVDAVTLVTGDGQVAENAVRDALLLAWTQSEAGEPIETLDRWTVRVALRAPRKGWRRFGADRRARALLEGGVATDDGTDVRRGLARLPWRQREVAVVRYLLRQTPRETAETLGMRERTVGHALSEAKASLATTLLPAEERPDDEALTERFNGAARHRQADPQLFERLVASMARRETTRRARTVVAVVLVVAAGAGIVALTERSPMDEASPSPTGGSRIPADAATLPGVPFPACHVSVTHSFASSGWFGVVYLFGKGSPSVHCLKLGSTPTYLAIDTSGVGRPSQTVVFGPIHCELACRAFATADIDGDRWAELAVVAADRPDADTIELYRVRPDAPTPLRQMTTVVSGAPVRFSFAWGGAGPFHSGATCPDTGVPATTDLDVWHAMRRDGVWHLRETFYAVHGVSVTKVGGKRSLVAEETGLPESRDFCGMPVGFGF
jgi:DNA-directed RNA polymerase specialized sigma24 family protein